MKGLRVLLFLVSFSLLPLPCLAQNALVLIGHDNAGPNIPTADYFFAEWIRWSEDQPGRNNRILSLAAGLDLAAEPADMGFDAVEGGGRVSRNGARLADRGFFDARERYLNGLRATVLANSGGAVSPSVLLLATRREGEVVRPRPFDAPLPRTGLVVYEARKWDDAIALSRRVAGRTLIVEYPPDGDDRWSRYWLRGPWPAGVPVQREVDVPGLVRGRSALALLTRPESFAWVPSDVGRWGGPNRWLAHGFGAAHGVMLLWFALAASVVAWGLAQVMNEDRGPFVSQLLVLVGLSPAALLIAGWAERLGGLEAWPVWIVVASVGVYGLATLGGMLARRFAPTAHPLWATCLLGLVASVLLDPLWSVFSGRFSPLEADVPGEAVGAFVAYLAGSVAFGPSRGFGRTLVGAILLWGVTAGPWWIGGHAALLVLPAVVLLAAEGQFRTVLLLALALLPTGLLRVAHEGFVWNRDDLLASADERDAPNLWRTATYLISPQWVGSLCFAAAVGLVGNRFLAYRLRKLLRLDPRLRALPWVAAATAALGVTEPLAIPAAPVVAFGALIALAYDGLRANA